MARLDGSGRPCSTCSHEDRNEIDRQLLKPNVTMSEISRIYGIHPRNLCRHRQLHLSALLKTVAAQQVVDGEVARGGSLLDQVGALGQRAMAILLKAENATQHDIAIKAIREARGCLELQAKLDGQIAEGGTTNVFISPTWVTVQTNLIAALLPYPEAREAVLKVLAPAH